MIHIFIKTFVLFFIFMSSSKAMEATYSSDGKELNIPIVVDKENNKRYRIKMSHLYGDNLIFGVTELTEIPSFNKRFESIVKNMTRKEVIGILGFPDVIYNDEITTELQYCSQPELGVGVTYEQWNYGVDRYSEGPSGSVVIFAALDSKKPREWTVSETFHGFVCM